MRGRGAVLALLLCLPFIFLFARLPPPELAPKCLSRVSVVHRAHFVHVCDSYTMTQAMVELPRYFTEPTPWRARPVYIIGGEGVAAVFLPAALLVRSLLIDGRIAGNFAVDLFLARFPEYFALMVVNFAVLGVTIWMAMRLVDPSQRALAAALGAALATCDLVHGLFWTQHSNFLNLIVPLGCIAYFVAGCRTRQMTQASIAAFGLAAGIGTLAYAYIIIWLPLFVFGSLYRDLRMAIPSSDTARGLIRTLLPLAIAGCGPVLAWWAVNEFWLHGAISYEVGVLRQFVWIVDAWRDGRLGAALAEHWNGYLPRAWSWLGWPAPVALAGIGLFAWLGRRHWRPVQMISDPIMLAVVLTIVTMLIFNFLQGYYQPRLVNGVTLALFVALARSAQKAERPQAGAAVLLAISTAQIVYAFLEPSISLT